MVTNATRRTRFEAGARLMIAAEVSAGGACSRSSGPGRELCERRLHACVRSAHGILCFAVRALVTPPRRARKPFIHERNAAKAAAQLLRVGLQARGRIEPSQAVRGGRVNRRELGEA